MIDPARAAALGGPIRGPSAFGGDFRRMVHLTHTLAVTDFKLRFFGSVLGYLWQLMRPLMLFGVLYVIFTKIAKVGQGVPNYGIVLLTGIVIFQFFAEVTSGAVSSVVDRENLVRKIQFPRLVIPLSIVLTGYFNMLLNFVVVLIFMAAAGVSVHWSWLEALPLVLAVGVLATGVAMIVSVLYVRFRDVRPIWDVALQIIFYATPILYPIEQINHPAIARHLVSASPLAAILEQMRHAVIDPSAPSAATAIGGAVRLVVPVVLLVAIFAFGLWLFNREAPRIADEL